MIIKQCVVPMNVAIEVSTLCCRKFWKEEIFVRGGPKFDFGIRCLLQLDTARCVNSC